MYSLAIGEGEIKIKLNIYQSESEDIKELKEILEEKSYVYQGNRNFDHQNVNFFYFTQIKKKKQPNWLLEANRFFGFKEDNKNIPEQYNGIILCKTLNNVYILSLGNAFHTVQDLSVRGAGIGFAEKILYQSGVSTIDARHLHSNKSRTIINFKDGLNELPKVNESFVTVLGNPSEEHIFGSNVKFGNSVALTKQFDINSKEEGLKNQNAFVQFFNELDISLTLAKKTKLPRLEPIEKKHRLNDILNKEVLNNLLGETTLNTIDVQLNLMSIQTINDTPIVMNNDYDLEIYVKNAFQNKEEFNFNLENLKKFVIENKEGIHNLNDIKFKISSESGSLTKEFSEIVNCEIDYNGELYLLVDKSWTSPNEKYKDKLKEQIDIVNEIVEYSSEYSFQYSTIVDKLEGEDAYIKHLMQKNKKDILHRKHINFNGRQCEIADLYDEKQNELVAVKMGLDTSKCIYSFEQINLGMNLLQNHQEFKIRERLDDYNKNGNHSKISSENIDKIIQCKTMSVLWVLDKEPAYAIKGISGENFDLNQIGSVLLKVAISNWYNYIVSNNMKPKIYFAIAEPIPTNK